MKQKKTTKFILVILLQYAITALVAFLFMLYQNSFEPKAIIDSFQVAAIFLFAAGWFVFINHHGLFDVLFHGLNMFVKSFVGKKPEKTLVEIRESRKKMPVYLFLSMWINAIIILGVTYIIFHLFL